MIQLTSAQIASALYAANEVESLEGAKDRVEPHIVRIQIGPAPKTKTDPLGQGRLLDYTVPASAIRQEIDSRLAAAHRELEGLGIELLPPTA